MESGQQRLKEIAILWRFVKLDDAAEVKISWIPAHAGISGNEKADRAAKQVSQEPLSPPLLHGKGTSSTIPKGRAKAYWERVWKTEWERSSKGRHSFKITSAPTRKALELHDGLPKPKSAMGIQLRTGDIGFREFLADRGVPGFESARCGCGEGHQSVSHVLLSCSTWAEQRREAFGALRNRDLRVILGEKEYFHKAIGIVWETGLLAQFRRAREKLSGREGQPSNGS